MVLAAALGVWAFINGRFLFAGYHALVASARVRGLPFCPRPFRASASSCSPPTPTTRCWPRGAHGAGGAGRGR